MRVRSYVADIKAVLASFNRQRRVIEIHTTMHDAYAHRRSMTSIEMERRSGKTTANAMLALALLICRPGVRVQIGICSNRYRDNIRALVIATNQNRARIIRSTLDRIVMQVDDEAPSHLFFANDATHDGGVADVVLLEDAQFRSVHDNHDDLWRSVGRTTVIKVSTPDELSSVIFGEPPIVPHA